MKNLKIQKYPQYKKIILGIDISTVSSYEILQYNNTNHICCESWFKKIYSFSFIYQEHLEN